MSFVDQMIDEIEWCVTVAGIYEHFIQIVASNIVESFTIDCMSDGFAVKLKTVWHLCCENLNESFQVSTENETWKVIGYR